MKPNIIPFPFLDEQTEAEESKAIEEVRRTIESFSWTYESLQEQLDQEQLEQEQKISEMSASHHMLKEIKGFVASAVVDVKSGIVLEAISGDGDFNIEVAASANSDMMRAKFAALDALGFGGRDKIEDMLITLGSQYHLIRPYSKDPNYFIYLALDKSQANLVMARRSLARAEQSLDF